MKFIALALAALIVSSGSAYARSTHLRGPAADAFIAEHFPKADIPGPVNGRFVETDRRGRHWGYARCSVPAMGSRSEGEVSTCAVTY